MWLLLLCLYIFIRLNNIKFICVVFGCDVCELVSIHGINQILFSLPYHCFAFILFFLFFCLCLFYFSPQLCLLFACVRPIARFILMVTTENVCPIKYVIFSVQNNRFPVPVFVCHMVDIEIHSANRCSSVLIPFVTYSVSCIPNLAFFLHTRATHTTPSAVIR